MTTILRSNEAMADNLRNERQLLRKRLRERDRLLWALTRRVRSLVARKENVGNLHARVSSQNTSLGNDMKKDETVSSSRSTHTITVLDPPSIDGLSSGKHVLHTSASPSNAVSARSAVQVDTSPTQSKKALGPSAARRK